MDIEKPKSLENKNKELIKNSDISVNQENNLAVVVIKPDAFAKKELIIKMLEDSGLGIVKTITKELPENFVLKAMYKDLPTGLEEETFKHFNSGPSEIVLLRGGEDLLQKIIALTGDKTNPEECDEKTIRYLFGEHFGRDTENGQYFRNAIHRASTKEEQIEDLEKFRTLP